VLLESCSASKLPRPHGDNKRASVWACHGWAGIQVTFGIGAAFGQKGATVANVRVCLRLPRDANALHLVRAVTDPVLAAGGADADGRNDMAAALTEACGNAIQHARTTDSYEVALSVEDGLCTAEVIDEGVGFHHDGPPTAPPASASSGRGLYLIAQLADWLEVDSRPGRGTTIRFVKRLTSRASAVHA